MRRIVSAVAIGLLLSVSALSAPTQLDRAVVLRGPYLQMGNTTSMMVVWGTGAPTTGTLRVGRAPGQWEREIDMAAAKTQVGAVRGLIPDTTYFYEVQIGDRIAATGADFRFTTHPPINSARPFRFLAWGDSGTGGGGQMRLADEINVTHPPVDLALILGDIVYPDGQWDGWDQRYFKPYEHLLRRAVGWPCIGNHDAKTERAAPYLANYVLPVDSGAPDHPSNTERYYSFDYGNTHFIALDSQTSDRTDEGPMYAWFKADLAHARARGAHWVVVMFHHPPYTKGTHDSDRERDLREMRKYYSPICENDGVDLVLTGHSHVYERSYLVQNGTPLQRDKSTYIKTDARGCLYVVSGSGGQSGSGRLDHPVMAFSRGRVLGASVFEITRDALRGYYLLDDGTTIDHFSLHKTADRTPPALVEASIIAGEDGALDRVRVVFDEPVSAATLSASHFAVSAIGIEETALQASLVPSAIEPVHDRRAVDLLFEAPAIAAMRAAAALRVIVREVADDPGIDPAGGDDEPTVVKPNALHQASLLFSSAPATTKAVPLDATSRPLTVVPAVSTATLRPDAAPNTAQAEISFTAHNVPDAATLVWDFGDGATKRGTDRTVAHVFAPSTGVQTRIALAVVSVAVLHGDSASVAYTRVYLHGQGDAPSLQLEASHDQTVTTGKAITFTANAADPDGGDVTIAWTITRGGNVVTLHGDTTETLTWTPRDAGRYIVTAIATDDEGVQVTTTYELAVRVE